jgi:hypothetical protein
MITLGMIVSIKGTAHYGVVTEIFYYWRYTPAGCEQPDQHLYNVHYIVPSTGKLMVCPDYARCHHEHTCPICSANCGIEQIEPFPENDIKYFVKEGMIDPELVSLVNDTQEYTICKHCDHFVDQNYPDGQTVPEGVAKYIHLEDGEQEFDHDAEPGTVRTLALWKLVRPDLFHEYPDEAIGPNSKYHSRRGKTD